MKINGYKFIHETKWSSVNHKLHKLNADIASATEFVREIERGNLDVSIGDNAIDSELKTSLVNMRDQMKKYSLTEKQRNWVNEGLAKFVQILRSGNNEGRHQLADNIIRNLVVYLKANQGALFAINDDNPNDIFLEMEACYAYDRKKYLEKRIELGEGLAGQVVLEKSTLYMTDVPRDFIKITSGLGEALPRNVLLVPLKLDEKIYGVVELASFQIFQSYEIDFIERLGESIASSIAAVKNNERTKGLLKETQLQAEQLKAQEEEVRQNLEELSATQEAMQRAMREVEDKEAYISQILNTSQDLIYTVDRDFRIVTWNRPFALEGERIGVRLEKGMNAFEWSPEDRKKLVVLYQRVFDEGKTFEIKYAIELMGKKYHFLAVYAPIRSGAGEILEAGIYSRNVTEIVEVQEESVRLLKEAQLQSEQLKAQEEELRQNMEELSATQDAMQRAFKGIEAKEAYTTQLLNTTQDVIYTVDREFKMVTWNSVFAREAERLQVHIEKGMGAFEWAPDDRKKLIELYKRALKGETFEINVEMDLGGKTYYFLSFYAPLKSPDGEIIEVGVYAKNVTELVQAQKQSEQLVKETQQQTEQLKVKEEELRQNMEELSTTQEVMRSTMIELEGKEAYTSELLNATDDLIYTVDKDFNLVTWNKAFGKLIGSLNVTLEKGMTAFEWLPDYRNSLIPLWTRAHQGETFQFQWEGQRDDGQRDKYLSIFAPVQTKTGEIKEAVVFAKNIAELIDAQQQLAQLLKEAQQQTEELKAQEEELRQNMEELSATQESMEKSMREAETMENYISQLLNVSGAIVFTVDRHYKLVTWNEAFSKTVIAMGVKPVKGMIAFEWRPDHERQHFVDMFKRVLSGEWFESVEESKFDGKVHKLLATYAPVKSKENEIIEVAVFAKDITPIVEGRSSIVSTARQGKKSVIKTHTPNAIEHQSDPSQNGKSHEVNGVSPE